MVILVLSGLGAIGVRNTILEARQVGNFRTGEQSLHVTEAGLAGVLARAIQDPDTFRTIVQSGKTLRMNDIVTPFFDTALKGSFGFEYSNLDEGATTKTRVDFVAKFTDARSTNRVPGGTGSSGQYYTKYRVTINGIFGNKEVLTTADDVLRNANRSFIAYVYLGPFSQQQGGGN